jgi:hypothetical protein
MTVWNPDRKEPAPASRLPRNSSIATPGASSNKHAPNDTRHCVGPLPIAYWPFGLFRLCFIYGILRIQRLWIENTLPEHQLLDAVASAYGRIAELVGDAHRQLGIPLPVTTDMHTGEKYPHPAVVDAFLV